MKLVTITVEEEDGSFRESKRFTQLEISGYMGEIGALYQDTVFWLAGHIDLAKGIKNDDIEDIHSPTAWHKQRAKELREGK